MNRKAFGGLLCAAALLAGPAARAETFTIGVIPDTQNYVDYGSRTDRE